MVERGAKLSGRWARAATLLLLAAALTIAAGCTQSTLHFPSGGTAEGEIERADQDFIYIVLPPPETVEESRDRAMFTQVRQTPDGVRREGRVHRVHRKAVTDIEHPGKAATIAGAVILSHGLATFVASLAAFGTCGGDGLCGLFLVFVGAPGGAVAIGGAIPMIIGLTSSAAGSSTLDETDVDIGLTPIIAPSEHGGTGGLAATVSW